MQAYGSEPLEGDFIEVPRPVTQDDEVILPTLELSRNKRVQRLLLADSRPPLRGAGFFQ
ncbi:hypothetical protein [Breznakiella homolactica]|uniref:Uncharacterized protein n=1 Tax=Breznakiella homolactica TaxID=2798577 RepID=A0A7T7XRA5_9SPIR|nr:hypothetical protein [Breznakiella homolactica]QQO11033.1 hypothetical protein JFL75_08985 [Breznakiella homolactica]